MACFPSARVRGVAVVVAVLYLPIAFAQGRADRKAVEARIAAHAVKGQLQQALGAYDVYIGA
jgi:hypothetical protein